MTIFYRRYSKFVDKFFLTAVGGKGGNGSASFARDNFNPRGKVDGGNGGDGGSVYALADTSVNSLGHLQHIYKAKNGADGGSNGCYGMKGEDIFFKVPLGTIISKLNFDGSKLIMDELNQHSASLLVSKGGKGGRGNRALKTNNHVHEKGSPGEELNLEIEMNTIADFGLVGQPNAGKSSFLACLSRTCPKIAPYPFTTISPNLGVTFLPDGTSLLIADIPGLVEGAHNNFGLGHQFLKHVKKSGKLILVIDISAQDPVTDAKIVIEELNLYQPNMSSKIALIVANKIDRLETYVEKLKELSDGFVNIPIIPVSAKYGYGSEKFKELVCKIKSGLVY